MLFTFFSARPRPPRCGATGPARPLQHPRANNRWFSLGFRLPAATDEFKAGHVEGAVNVPIRTLAQRLNKLPPDKAAPIAVVCKSGIRAAYGTMTLKLLGYTTVKDMAGGMLAWEKDGLPVTK